MFGADFKRRARIESIADFLLTGEELSPDCTANIRGARGADGSSVTLVNAASLEDQYSRLEKAYINCLKSMKPQILAEPWDTLSADQAERKLEDIISSAFDAASDIQDLYFRAGLLAGATLASQLEKLMEIDN